MNGTVLVRAPGSRLAEGIVTHISRTAVDVSLARAQHAAYGEALAASGWVIRQVPPAEDCPDSVFIEDAVVVCEDLAVLARPGAPARRAEVPGVAAVIRSLGLRTAQIREPGTLDLFFAHGVLRVEPAGSADIDVEEVEEPGLDTDGFGDGGGVAVVGRDQAQWTSARKMVLPVGRAGAGP